MTVSTQPLKVPTSASPPQTLPSWLATMEAAAEDRQRPPLDQDVEVDVCVVGAGIAGLSTAYRLAREGRSVIVLDDGSIGGGQTERTSAHLSNALDDRFCELEKIHGQEAARLAAASHTAAIDQIASIVAGEGIDCGFRRVDGYLFVPPGESLDVLHEELAAARRAGLTGVEMVDQVPFPTYDAGPALRFPNQAQFQPLDYLVGLARACEKLGGRICTGTHAGKIQGGDAARVETADGPVVTAKAVVVATNTPINDLLAIHTKQAPYSTYVVGIPVRRDSVPWALYWDTLHAYHYVRLQRRDESTDLLLVGGEDHKLGQKTEAAECFDRLEAWASLRFQLQGPVEYTWSGIVMETTDGLAYIGRNPGDEENVYIATGDSGMGLTHGTIAGMLLTDLIQGHPNAWRELYDPARIPVWGMAWKQYLRENANVAMQYARDWLGGGDVSSAEYIPAGSGAVVRDGLKPVAVYRNESGALTELDAVCPHLQCVVHWNGVEKCWDCPCHGSRFDARGEVLNGPANTGLKPKGA